MTHAALLGTQVHQIVFVGFDLDRDAFGDLHAEIGKLIDLVRIVGQKTQFLCTEISEDLCTDVVFAQVSGKAQGNIGVQGVKAFLLQLISLEFIDETDPSAFLAHVEEDASAFFFDLGHGCCQLIAAVAA